MVMVTGRFCLANLLPVSGPQAKGRNGVVVSGNADSAVAGLEVLRQGGNAADAAVAVLLAESVANSEKFCFGGEVAILVYDAGRGAVDAVSGVGAAPQMATREYFKNAGGIKSGTLQAAAIPAVLDACVTLLERYGTMRFGEVAPPALKMLDAGRAKWHGDLAGTLRRLIDAENDAGDRQRGLRSVRDCFYRGPLARDIDAWSRAHGGLIRYNDLANHATRVEPPVRVDYRGYTVCKCGPWTQGPVLLEALQLLEGFDLKAMGLHSADSLHVIVEAMKLAFADRDTYYGDPLCANVPLDRLLSKEYADERRRLIDMQNASLKLRPGRLPGRLHPQGAPPTAHPPRTRDTTTCLVADRQGNIVAATPSGWGGALAGDTGIWLGSRLISLNTQKGHPNCIAPGKRPRITLTPTIVLKAGKPVLAVSVAGGDTQDQAGLQIVTDFIDFGLDAAGLVATPRYATGHYIGSFNQRPPILGGLTMDPRIGADVLDALRRRGHKVNPTTVTGQERIVIVIDQDTGMIFGAGDPGAAPARAAAAF